MVAGYKLELAEQAAMLANRTGMLDSYQFIRVSLVKSQVAILMYHRIEPERNSYFFPYSITVSDFENQLNYLVKHYSILSLNELVDHIYEQTPLPKKAVVLTFDDGYKDNYTYAYPILKKYNMPATVFLTTGHIGSGEPFWWDKISYVLQHTTCDALELDEMGLYPLKSNGERLRAAAALVKRLNGLPELQKNLLIEKIVSMSAVNVPAGLGKDINLSWDEVREMRQGGITIGAHTVTHAFLTKLLSEEARREIIESRKIIEENINQPVIAFSYPGAGLVMIRQLS